MFELKALQPNIQKPLYQNIIQSKIRYRPSLLWLAEYPEKWKTHTLADGHTSNMQYLHNYHAASKCKWKALEKT